ncbi:MAG TPA: biopolymer transporter ExbD [Longimicrobiales bacterium]|nr:biopolymer transporter ExbD [Longimicrobiales bacterium]
MSAQGPTQSPSSGRSPTAFGGSAIPSVGGIGGAGVTADINVTPMVDVMLVLLIIFMVVTPVLTQYEAMVPTAVHVTPEPDEDVITLGIDVQGEFFVEGQHVASNRLQPVLRQIYERRPGDHLMFLRADRGVGYNVVLDGIEAARGAGVRTIGAIIEPIEAGQRREED